MVLRSQWDGYRALAVKDGATVRLISRNQKDLTRDYPSIVAALRTVRQSSFILDGEIVALEDDGRPSFQALQHRSTAGLAIVYYDFDVLMVGAESLLRQSLDARGSRLKLLILGSQVLWSEPLPPLPRSPRSIQHLRATVEHLGLKLDLLQKKEHRHRHTRLAARRSPQAYRWVYWRYADVCRRLGP